MFAVIEDPAGGAAIGEVLIASSAALVLTIGLLVLGMGHRTGRVALLGNLAAFTERRSGLPGWVGLPSAIAGASLLAAVFGMYWDISLHIDVGRDAGPLANPAHYFILGGLFGIFAAGVVAIVLPAGKPSSSSIEIGENWYAPLGGLLICAAAAFALLGFPLDDVWHRLFGQDVTLWGPTHLMLIGGASLTLVGMAVLLVEGQRFNKAAAEARIAARVVGRRGADTEAGWVDLTRRTALCGAFLLGLSTFQGEFDFGVPQFRFVFGPLLIMLAAGAGIVAVRLWAGRGAALGAVGFFLLVRGLLALLVGPVLGETTPHFPLYVAEALVVEAIALAAPTLLRRPLAFGLVSGLGIGTIGLAAEWGWTHVWSPIPWSSNLLPEAIVFGLPAAIAGALIGAWIGDRLALEARDHDRRLDVAALVAALGATALVGIALYKPGVEGVSAQVTLTNVQSGPDRTVEAVVRMQPADAADDAEYLTATAWQGGGFIVDRLQRIDEGVYRTTQPIPVHGGWKALIRMSRGNTLSAIPIFLPEDRAIPARGVPAPQSFTRTFVADHRLLQREQKTAQGWLWAVAYTVVGLIFLSLLALMAWALRRLSDAAGEPPVPPAERRAAASAPAPRPTPQLGGA
ncbi:hypothetical protein Q5424_04300 [Conexibacter sp. JD483]|uniref:hypothetical protein n=1 Tax=unclassified Conexibacter TaxID=2627773 RepID=UPI002716F3E7|nr:MULTISPECIES: hypothetical protein [unclassified Conexibacter]MDO8184946.1 hypothetical protein [Conexibacter sp. CPCC 205706]MDO8198090.1 hypothetical protein [Conexibacter sp. CPCC 205762]MDR9368288.1 hypothetical protein [Conexibacter sp. JD483]